VTEPLPAEATDLSPAIAEKVLLRSLAEIDAPLVLPDEVAAGVELVPVAGVELLLELLELLQPAATSTAANAAAAVRPARADTEYNGVPRSFTQTCHIRHVRDQIRITRSQLAGPLAEMLDVRRETFPLTLS
jgi:Tfp pilus assembly protein PilZ